MSSQPHVVDEDERTLRVKRLRHGLLVHEIDSADARVSQDKSCGNQYYPWVLSDLSSHGVGLLM